MLDLQLLSALHCLKWQQAISPAALQLLQKLLAPAVTHIKCATLPKLQQPAPCCCWWHSCRRGKISFPPKLHILFLWKMFSSISLKAGRKPDCIPTPSVQGKQKTWGPPAGKKVQLLSNFSAWHKTSSFQCWLLEMWGSNASCCTQDVVMSCHHLGEKILQGFALLKKKINDSLH